MSTNSGRQDYFDDWKATLRYDFGFIAIDAALAVSTILLLWISSCGSRATDAKHGVFGVPRRWIVASLSLYLIYLLLMISDTGLSTGLLARYISNHEYTKRATGDATAEEEARQRLPAFVSFVNDIAISVTIVEAGRGLTGSVHETPGSTLNSIRLGCRYPGLDEKLSTNYILLFVEASNFSASGNGTRLVDWWVDRLKLIKLVASVDIIWWVTSLPLLGYSIYVVRKVKSDQLSHKSAILLLVASALNVFRFTYRLIMTMFFSWVQSLILPAWLFLVTFVLENFAKLLVLALLVAIITRR
ncbi:hypothetical protein B0T22DRAFT_509192 [Podospora appendiculata]|uniref:Uncharacterized protein n=1 Tax=Podospora appendiculata TaxID=314037 RepID=A0AAE1CIN1_9PEZI|nr:hypothetical protein B0T22DRAFT_509192 [Podospora appendiculata]